ncbi:MAG: hypothetical protein F9B45_20695 [Phycisphaera sp. RhM]|nr:hypothetical protein [Phycisphaera sp. RhM]
MTIEWKDFVENARRHGVTDLNLVCIDFRLQGSSQTPEQKDILNTGGFSDAVFNVASSFLGNDAFRFVREVDAVEL